jgi:hypothetical protein
MDWKDIWGRLKDLGWSLELNSPGIKVQTVIVFFAPKINVKTSIEGVTKFSQGSKQVREILQKLFPSGSTTVPVIAEETQDWINDKTKAHEKLKNWNLTEGRRQRSSIPNKRYKTGDFTQTIEFEEMYTGPSAAAKSKQAIANSDRDQPQKKQKTDGHRKSTSFLDEQSTQAQVI